MGSKEWDYVFGQEKRNNVRVPRLVFGSLPCSLVPRLPSFLNFWQRESWNEATPLALYTLNCLPAFRGISMTLRLRRSSDSMGAFSLLRMVGVAGALLSSVLLSLVPGPLELSPSTIVISLIIDNIHYVTGIGN